MQIKSELLQGSGRDLFSSPNTVLYSWMCLLVFPLQSVTCWLREASVPSWAVPS